MIRYRLNEEGIFPVARWELDGRAIRPGSLPEDEPASEDGSETGAWIYAFVVGNRVMYLSTTGRRLRARLDDYEASHHPASLRVREQIRKALMTGQEVEIFARAGDDPDALRRECDFLIDELDPPWNRVPRRAI